MVFWKVLYALKSTLEIYTMLRMVYEKTAVVGGILGTNLGQ